MSPDVATAPALDAPLAGTIATLRARASKFLRLHTMSPEHEEAVQPLAYAMKYIGGLKIIFALVLLIHGA